MRLKPGFILIFLLIAIASQDARAQSITIQGRVVDSAGNPVNGALTQFRVQILTPNSNLCVLYDETQVIDLSQSSGLFSINLNNGSGTVNLPSTYTLEQALSNLSGFAVNSSYCDPSAGPGTITYSPSAFANRKVLISFRDPGTMSGFETIPAMDLNPVPYAMESRAIGGFNASSLLRVQDSGVPGTAAPLSAAQFTELQSLINGTSNNYMSSVAGSTTGAMLPTVAGNPSSPSAGSIWFDTATGELKYHDGSNPQVVGSASAAGDITNVSAGTGLSGGGASGSVTLSLATSGVTAASYGGASAVPVLTVDAYGRITAATTAAITGTLPSGTSGQFLKSNGTAWSGQSITMADLKSTIGGANLFASPGCTAAQSLYWDSGTDQIKCQAIGGLDASVITAGTIDAARLPAGADAWTVASGNVYRSTGNVGIGTTSPLGLLHVHNSSAQPPQEFTLSSSTSSIGLSSYWPTIEFNSYQPGSGATKKAYGAGYTGAIFFEPASGNFTWATGTAPGAGNTTTETVRLFIKQTGEIGVGTLVPTASLHLKAGAAAANGAPLKFTPGTSLTTPENGAVEYDGTDLFLTSGGVRRRLAATAGSNDFTGVGSIVGSGALSITAGGTNQNLTLAGSGTGQVQSTSVLNVTNNTASTSSTTGALVVSGGVGVTGAINSGSSISAATSMRAPQIYGSAAASGTLSLDGTSDATKGFVLLNSGGGNVGIGTNSPSRRLEVVGDGTIPSVVKISNGSVNSGLLIDQTDAAGTGRPLVSFAKGGSPRVNQSYDNVGGNFYLDQYNGTTLTNRLAVKDSGEIFFRGPASEERMTVNAIGNVGIGIASPTSKLHVSDTARTETAAGSVYSSQFMTSLAPTADSDASFFGIRSQLDTQSAAAHNYTNALSAAYNRMNFNGTGTSAYAYGTYSVAANATTGTITNARGAYNRAANIGAGTVTNSHGSYNLSDNLSSGTLANSYGILGLSSNTGTGTITSSHGAYARSINSTTGSITSAFGVRSQVYNESTGTIGTAYGMFVDLLNASGTVTTWYGLHLADAGVSPSYYAIFSPGNTKSYLNGNLGLGISSPSAMLHLKAGTATAGTAPLKFAAGTSLTTPENGALEYDGTDLFLTSGGVRRKLAATAGSNDFTGVGSITGSGALTISAGGTNQNLTLAGSGTGQVQSTSVLNVTNATASTSPTTGALIVAGGLGVSGAINSGSTISAATSMMAPQIYGSTAASGTLMLDGTSHATKGHVLLNSAGGNVGIGTTSPSSLLQVQGTAAANNLFLGPIYGSQPIFNTYTNASESGTRLQISGGNAHSAGLSAVSYQTNVAGPNIILGHSRTSTLGAQGALVAGDELGVLGFQGSDGSRLIQSAKIDAIASATAATDDLPAALRFFTRAPATASATERMRIDASGNVGIGTSIPGYPLDVNGYARVRGSGSQFIVTDNTSIAIQGNSASAGSIEAFDPASASTKRPLTLNAWGGNVGIGTTSPGGKFDVTGTAGKFLITDDAAHMRFTRAGINYIQASTAAGELQFGVNGNADGTAAMHINSSGNVGIGTASPTSNLHIAGSGGDEGNPGIFIQDPTTNSNYGGALTYDDRAGANVVKLAAIENSAESGYLAILRSNGNIGINTTTPNSKFEVVGHSAIANHDSWGGQTIMNFSNTSNGQVAPMPTNWYSGLYISNARGTRAAPSATQSGDWLGLVRFSGYGTSAYPSGSANAEMRAVAEANFTNSAAPTSLVFATAGATGTASEKLRLTSAGWVGIGTTVPSSMLHANQSINNGAVVTVSNPNTGSLAYANVNVNNDSGTGVNLFINSSTRATDGGVNGATLRNDIGDLRLQGLGGFNTNIGITVKGTTGNVGIGTSAPVTRLDVTGDITQSLPSLLGGGLYFNGGWRFRDGPGASAGLGAGIKFDYNEPAMQFLTASGNTGAGSAATVGISMVIKSNGNVGIGSSNPGYKLDVQGGGVNASGGYTQVSDLRLKTNLEPLQESLNKLLALRTIRYDWKDPAKYGHEKQIGLVAQDVEKAFPEAVKRNQEGLLSVSYPNLVAPVIDALRELYERLSGTEDEVAALKAENARLKAADEAKARDIASVKQENAEMKARLDRIERLLKKK